MDEHVHAWLEAYHDGELHGRRLQQVESHLASCKECRSELEALQNLSALLQESPSPAHLMPPDRFVAQVGLRLPRRQEEANRRGSLNISWRAIPFGLFGMWAFIQALFIVIDLILLGLTFGLGDLLSQGALISLNRNELLLWSIGLNIGLSMVIGLLYLSWLVSWWVGRQHTQNET
ncbi:MAG: zf-HC2 domain-containing protein [Anaerolineae bacterium]|nr:zf-HC2 domain-containing protein [Anaerolineae bacterium]